MSFVFDPRDLISPPYITCPNGHEESYGILSIGGTGYSRRCRECWVTNSYPLPKLTKKVVYIDQFAISNMMKALNDEMDSHARAKADPFWLEMFDALERVSKLQLVVCPVSGSHRNESLMVSYFPALKRMYEQLSHGVSFDDSAYIVDRQIVVALEAWLKGEAPAHDFDAENVTNGDLNAWQDRLIISVEMEWPAEVVEGVRRFRDSVSEKVAEVFKFYQEQGKTHKDFGHWFEHERSKLSETVPLAAANYAARVKQMLTSGELDLSKLQQYRSRGYDTFQNIWSVMKTKEIKPEDVKDKIDAFLTSDAYKDTPANRLGTLMWAVIAHQAANGRTNPPNKGMSTDIDTVSTLLPYCDAILVDRECAALVGNIPKKFSPGFGTRIFSPATKTEFLAYLKQIETEADKAVVAAVKEVYGDKWLIPFREMYNVERARRERERSTTDKASS
ncbi:MAG: hypothetical protein WC815_17800 [Vicinamibacterales bacterium]|jgi:hypothetical protein